MFEHLRDPELRSNLALVSFLTSPAPLYSSTVVVGLPGWHMEVSFSPKRLVKPQRAGWQRHVVLTNFSNVHSELKPSQVSFEWLLRAEGCTVKVSEPNGNEFVAPVPLALLYGAVVGYSDVFGNTFKMDSERFASEVCIISNCGCVKKLFFRSLEARGGSPSDEIEFVSENLTPSARLVFVNCIVPKLLG